MIRSILLFGARCDFADYVSDRIIEAGYEIPLRMLPGDPGSIHPVTYLNRSEPIEPNREMPVQKPNRSGNRYLVLNDRNSPVAAETLAHVGADLVVLCCYPARVPQALINTARLGGLNVHPSLLPRHRGPDPLFWVFRNGEAESGVTVHQVDEGLDTGPILKQERIPVPTGTGGDVLWRQSMEIGARLLLKSIQGLSSGSSVPRQQGDEGASYESWPEQSDLLVDPTTWEAWRIHHFCSGVIPMGHRPYLKQGRFLRPIQRSFGFEEPGCASAREPDRGERVTTVNGKSHLLLGAPEE